MTSLDVNNAILLYLHDGNSAWPESDRNIVLQKYGTNIGNEFLITIDAILNSMEIISKTINWDYTSDINSMKIVRSKLSSMYPFLSNHALDALAKAFAYWWK